MDVLANILALLFGSIFMSALTERLWGATRFSLPLLAIFLVVIVGGLSTLWFGWVSTLILLSFYAFVCAIEVFKG
jgi:hypothetical protein